MKQTEKEIIHNMYNQLDPLLTNFIITHDPENLDDFRKILYTKCDFILELINKTKQKNYNPRDKKRFIKNIKPIHFNPPPRYNYYDNEYKHNNYNRYNSDFRRPNFDHYERKSFMQSRPPMRSERVRYPAPDVNNPEHPFNKYNPYANKYKKPWNQNTVTMRTVRSNPSYRPHQPYPLGPNEVTHIEKQNERIEELEKQLKSLQPFH
jgi:hypothetical protein